MELKLIMNVENREDAITILNNIEREIFKTQLPCEQYSGTICTTGDGLTRVSVILPMEIVFYIEIFTDYGLSKKTTVCISGSGLRNDLKISDFPTNFSFTSNHNAMYCCCGRNTENV